MLESEKSDMYDTDWFKDLRNHDLTQSSEDIYIVSATQLGTVLCGISKKFHVERS